MRKFIIDDIEFSGETYKTIIEKYCDSFTRASLSIERAYEQLNQYDNRINSILKDKRKEFEQLTIEEKNKIINKYHYFITYMAYYKGMIPKIDFENQQQINDTYKENFEDFDNFITELLAFDDNGQFIENETGRNISMFFPLYIERKPIFEKAINTKKDHIKAFLYALNLEHIGSNEMIKINETINYSDPNTGSGFKKVNNAITGSTFETMKKEEIPVQIAELIYKYDNNFDMEIKDPFEEEINEEEKYKRIFMICLKEARFHILLEHIHPFSDGNGRTGRIIMSTNLIRQHIAPPLITMSMLEQYKKFINDYDYNGLAQMIMDSSSQTLNNWITEKRNIEGITKEDASLDYKTI